MPVLDYSTDNSSWKGFELLDAKRQNLMSHALEPHLLQSFGYHALLYSPLAKQLCGENLLIKHQVVIGPERPPLLDFLPQLNLICHYEELPIASDSIDLVLLPNILQNHRNPHQILREVERVLIPEGVAVIIGRNPVSWLGLKHYFLRFKAKQKPIFCDISRRRLGDWFSLLGFDIEHEINISLSNSHFQQGKYHPWVKKMGQFFCDWFCSYYIIVARKKVSTLTPLRPSWRRNKQLVSPRLAEPSVRHQVEQWFEQLK